MQKQKRGKKFLAFILFIVLLGVSAPLWLPYVGTFLVIEDTVQKADCIVPLRGALYPRFKNAVQLYRQGYAKNIVVSVLPEYDEDSEEYDVVVFNIYGYRRLPRREFTVKAFEYFGKDHHNVYFTNGDVTSTYEEAVATRDLLRRKRFTSMILVTSAYHSRRAQMLFETVFRNSGITIYYSVVNHKGFNPYRWWRSEGEVRMVMREYLTMAHNIIYHVVLGKTRTYFDE